MADDTRRQRESVSLTPVTHGLENMAAEFLESMVRFPLPPQLDHSRWVGGALVYQLPLLCPANLCFHSAAPSTPLFHPLNVS